MNELSGGIYCVHKPVGPSSFSVLKSVAPKRLRSCHGGTLDPFASGLLLVLVEPATQVFDLLHDVPKVYDATICWGVETSNGDPTGVVVRQSATSHLTVAAIERTVQEFIGWHDQVPPATSAKRIGGERAYERAHRGESVELPAVRVYLHQATWLSHSLPSESRLQLTVRGGFYVRSLVRDLARSLDSAAHLAALHRVSIGPWNDPGVGKIERVDFLPWLATRGLSDQDVHELKNDRPIEIGQIEPPTWTRPDGFAAEVSLVRGVHLGWCNFLLEQRESRLYRNRLLRGGVAL